jgi:hypothetical protein
MQIAVQQRLRHADRSQLIDCLSQLFGASRQQRALVRPEPLGHRTSTCGRPEGSRKTASSDARTTTAATATRPLSSNSLSLFGRHCRRTRFLGS